MGRVTRRLQRQPAFMAWAGFNSRDSGSGLHSSELSHPRKWPPYWFSTGVVLETPPSEAKRRKVLSTLSWALMVCCWRRGQRLLKTEQPPFAVQLGKTGGNQFG
jgi:hypothetical protein